MDMPVKREMDGGSALTVLDGQGQVSRNECAGKRKKSLSSTAFSLTKGSPSSQFRSFLSCNTQGSRPSVFSVATALFE
jgi:hypothetical protein